MKYALDSTVLIRRYLQRSKFRVLLLDFDGTLVSIQKRPEDVFLEKRLEKVLLRLSRNHAYRICILSGRSLSDLRQYIRLRKALLFGNHGLEFESFKHRSNKILRLVKKQKPVIDLIKQKLQYSLGLWPGVRVEDKGLSLSIHYRSLSRDRMIFFKELIQFFQKKYRSERIIWRNGKKVVEIRPNIGWDKGKAALFLTQQFPRASFLVIGDDATDEDMFKALRNRSVTVRVGKKVHSYASYYLKNQKQVSKFLEKTCL